MLATVALAWSGTSSCKNRNKYYTKHVCWWFANLAHSYFCMSFSIGKEKISAWIVLNIGIIIIEVMEKEWWLNNGFRWSHGDLTLFWALICYLKRFESMPICRLVIPPHYDKQYRVIAIWKYYCTFKMLRKKNLFYFKNSALCMGDIFLMLWKTILYFILRVQARKKIYLQNEKSAQLNAFHF